MDQHLRLRSSVVAFGMLILGGCLAATSLGHLVPLEELELGGAELGVRLWLGSMGVGVLMLSAFFAGTAILGRPPLHGDDPRQVVQAWSAASGDVAVRCNQPWRRDHRRRAAGEVPGAGDG